MRKNFLTTGAVIALAWFSLAPLSLLFVALIASSPYAMEVKMVSLFLTLFFWIFLSMGTGLLWRRELQKGAPSPVKEGGSPHSKPKEFPMESLRTLQELEFADLCLCIFKRMWPEAILEKVTEERASPQDWLLRFHEKRYLIRCESQRTFLDSREIESFKETLKAREAQGGYFFTTGIFSGPAQEAASPLRIELIDGLKTRELMESFLGEKDFPPFSPPERSERRRYPRLACDRLLPEARPLFEVGNVFQRTSLKPELLNLSKGGVCITCPEPGALPTFFQARLRLPSVSSPLHILSEVVWLKPQSAPPSHRYGISFISMTNDCREKLTRWIQSEQERRMR